MPVSVWILFVGKQGHNDLEDFSTPSNSRKEDLGSLSQACEFECLKKKEERNQQHW